MKLQLLLDKLELLYPQIEILKKNLFASTHQLNTDFSAQDIITKSQEAIWPKSKHNFKNTTQKQFLEFYNLLISSIQLLTTSLPKINNIYMTIAILNNPKTNYQLHKNQMMSYQATKQEMDTLLLSYSKNKKLLDQAESEFKEPEIKIAIQQCQYQSRLDKTQNQIKDFLKIIENITTFGENDYINYLTESIDLIDAFSEYMKDKKINKSKVKILLEDMKDLVQECGQKHYTNFLQIPQHLDEIQKNLNELAKPENRLSQMVIEKQELRDLIEKQEAALQLIKEYQQKPSNKPGI